MGETTTTAMATSTENTSHETDLHRRRHSPAKISISSPEKTSIEQQSVVPWLASFFTYISADKIDVHLSLDEDEKKKKKKKNHHPTSTKSFCSCRQLCCKLFLFFCVIYFVMYLRPDYSIYVRNSFEHLLTKYNLTSEEYRLRPGQRLAAYRQASMPIIIIPGIISTGLELWQGEKCAEGRFRHRFWTSMQMVDNIGRDHQCWLRHISLNLSTW